MSLSFEMSKSGVNCRESPFAFLAEESKIMAPAQGHNRT